MVIVALALSAVGPPLSTQAQPTGKVFRIGFLSGGIRPSEAEQQRSPFLQALRELGYVEGKTLILEGRWAEGKTDRLPNLAAELVQLKVDLIVTFGGAAAEAAKEVASATPVVIVAAGDPVGTGLVASLARPGGRITGVTDQSTELSGKRLELLKAAVPRLSRVAVLWNSTDRAMTLRYKEIEAAASALAITIQPFGLRVPSDFDGAFAGMTQVRPDALLMVTDSLTSINRKRVLDFAAAQRLPAMYEFCTFVNSGGLISYGPSLPDMFRRAAYHVDRILKGAKPGDLPVEQPTRFYLVINMKTAKALGLKIPQSVLVRADEVIQ